jgi:ABC-type nickel/cobalt efflux system permease component RcnA
VLILAVAALLAAAWPLRAPPRVLAHPLDECLQALYVTLGSTGVAIELDLTPGVLVAPQVIALIDTDGDGQITNAEAQAYARSVLDQITVDLDRQPYRLAPTKLAFPPMLNLTAGAGVIQLEAALDSNSTQLQLSTGPHEVTVHNTYSPLKSAYQSAVVLQSAAQLSVRQQTRDELQQSLRVDYSILTPVVAVPASAAIAEKPSLGGMPVQERAILDTLADPGQSPGLLLVAGLLAAVLGGLHGLTPGHGKALLASYLVGSRGTVRHAVFLGGSITFTHTMSVIAIGILALVAGQLIVPQLLAPTLEIISGLLVLGLGIRLVWTRWRSLRLEGAHLGYHHAHAPDEHPHSHEHPHATEQVTWRSLAVMGASGGLTPCPEAIGILLIAVGLNRVVLGLGLITAFSLGLAVVLCCLGLLLVRARGLVERIGAHGAATQRLLPLGSAVVVTLLGGGILVQAALPYLPRP